MKILIEGHQYNEEDVRPILKGFEPFSKDGKISVEYVGYFYSKEISDCIFFLPKVLMNEKGFILDKDGLTPEKILDLGKALQEKWLEAKDYEFISNFSVWIFRAIKEYYRLNPDSTIMLKKSFSILDKSQNEKDATLLDIILSLIRFNNENQDFFMFTIKNIHSGYNKINWTKTISKNTPIYQGKAPIYINAINKKKQVNFDEELLIIFFSILSHLSKYGFNTTINCNYNLLSAPAFNNYCNGYGKVRLRQIKYKYFSDKALMLWHLCYAFFDSAEKIHSSTQECDYLLAKNFNIVFESIIDELVGDNKRDIPTDLHDQPDGKIVDHIYKYQSLTNDNEIYYIGDSKYYKIGGQLGTNSVYKQFTYAKNVIQFNINWFYQGKKHINYRDELTEGYNITPNFFISAQVYGDNLSYSDSLLTLRESDKEKRVSFQFKNRLFDRDTLWLSHYDVNFLYVIALYAKANDYEKGVFKQDAQNKFKQHIQKLLNEQYDFYLLEPKEEYSLQRAVDINFKRLYGKIFCPFEHQKSLVLSLTKSKEDIDINKQLKKDISPYFYIHENYKLGEEVSNILEQKQFARETYTLYTQEEDFFTTLAAEDKVEYNTETIERIFTDNEKNRASKLKELELSEKEVKDLLPIEQELVLVGYFNGAQHLSEIQKNQLYFVRTGFRPGSIKLVSGFEDCKYLFIHHKQEKYLFRLKGERPRMFTGEQLAQKGFANNKPEEQYLGFKLDDQTPIQIEDIKLSDAIISGIGNRTADSYFTTLKELFGV